MRYWKSGEVSTPRAPRIRATSRAASPAASVPPCVGCSSSVAATVKYASAIRASRSPSSVRSPVLRTALKASAIPLLIAATSPAKAVSTALSCSSKMTWNVRCSESVVTNGGRPSWM